MSSAHTRKSSRFAALLAAASLAAALLAAVPAVASEGGDESADDVSQSLVIQGAEELGPFTPTLSALPLRDVAPVAGWQPGDPIVEVPRINHRGDIAPPGEPANPTTWSVDPLLQIQEGVNRVPQRALSTPDLNFAGQAFSGSNPPDTVGDVGSTYYIQAINGAGALGRIYFKSTGAPATAQFDFSSLGGSGPCATGSGDPIVLYDHLAGRWVLSEFAATDNHLCVYVSQTGDPLGSWWAYDFVTPNFPDYPKYAVWPDAYYVSSNEAGGPAAYALDRNQMLAGLPATMQRFAAAPLAAFGFQALTPADLDGPAPPAGSPGYFARHRDDEAHNPGSNDPTRDFLDIFEFSVDWGNPANSTFTGPVSIPVTEFDSELCGFVSFQCFEQPSGQQLDPLREVVMWRLVYRNFGAHEKLVGNFVTDVDGTDHGGVRWFELRQSGGAAWSVFQEGTYAPDADSRWMGSIATDQNGNMALGYNVTSPTQTPDLRYVGRLASDPAGTMPDGEYTLVAAGGSGNSNRWGDYSSMNVDPIDGCTFWFTGMTALASGNWATQIGSFSFDACEADQPPSASDATFTVSEAASVGTVIGTVVASDPEGAPLSFSITGGNTGGAFAIGATSGQLTIAAPLDAETTPTYALTVEVSDGTLTATAAVTVNVTDVFDIPTTATFRDVPTTDIFFVDVEWLAWRSITKGCNPPLNDLFCPDDSVTRGQMAAFMRRALEGVVAEGPAVSFVDDDGSVFEADIEWLGATGITKGCNPPVNDRFCPDDPVRRAQMAAFMRRALG